MSNQPLEGLCLYPHFRFLRQQLAITISFNKTVEAGADGGRGCLIDGARVLDCEKNIMQQTIFYVTYSHCSPNIEYLDVGHVGYPPRDSFLLF